MTEPNNKVSVSRRFSISPERVFDAWLDPEAIGKWMFGPAVRDEEIVRMRLDPHVGGSFSFIVRRQGEEIDHVGQYLEIFRPRRLMFTWGVKTTSDRSKVTVDIVSIKTGCEVTLTHELHPNWADYADRTAAAWTKMLATLAEAFKQDLPMDI
jgi:uncharacterized protein YndB with AHSA1/START domain